MSHPIFSVMLHNDRRILRAMLFLSLVSFLIFTSYFHSNILSSTWLRSRPRENLADRFVSQPNKPFFPPLQKGSPATDLIDNQTLSSPSALCANFPSHLLDEIQVVIKTGVSEKTETQAMLATFAACIPNVLIFSDAEEYIDGHHIIDILSDLPPSYAIDNPDWVTYTAQHHALAEGRAVPKTHDAWKLDRFKFLPMVDKAFRLAPDARWYVFIEADVYYFWDTLFRLLDPLDAEERHYLGVPTAGSHRRWFAYGGGGIVLSRGLVRDLLQGGKQQLSAKYEKWVRKDCCGDAVLAYVILKELGNKLEALYPIFSGEALEGLAVTREKWCIPLLGLHRVSPQQMEELWIWERSREYDEVS